MVTGGSIRGVRQSLSSLILRTAVSDWPVNCQLAPQKEVAVNKTLGMILIAFGLFGLALGRSCVHDPGKGR